MLRHPATGSRGACARIRNLLTGAGLLGLLGWALPVGAQAPAPNKASCAEAYESAQESRVSGALQETRSRLAYCAHVECPAFVQKDCARWLEEVDRELPSVVVSVVGLDPAAAPLTSLKIDGRAIPDPLSGKLISLDPGKHELVLERPGAEPVTRTILAQQGVQNRNVEILLGDAAPAAAESTFEADAAAARAFPLRSLAYAAWGVGAVGFGTFAVLGTLARADKKGLQADCPAVTSVPESVVLGSVCLDTTVDRRKSKYEREEVWADVGLIGGIAGAAAGTVLFVLSTRQSAAAKTDASRTSSARLHLDVSPTPGGAWASLTGRF